MANCQIYPECMFVNDIQCIINKYVREVGAQRL